MKMKIGYRINKPCSVTCIVGLRFQYVDLRAVCQPVFQADVQEASLGAGHPLQEGQQRHRLFAFVPALEPFRQDANLVSEHHGASPSQGERGSSDGEKRARLKTRKRRVLRRTAGFDWWQSWDPLRLDRGALTWFRCRRGCRQVGCALWRAVQSVRQLQSVVSRGGGEELLNLACSGSRHRRPVKINRQTGNNFN